LVSNGVIQSAGGNAPAGATVIDLGDATLLAGFINARKTVLAGFTTVRDVGSSHFIDVGLRNAINAGYVPGNPVENIKATQSVIFVMKDGAVLRNDRAVPR